MPSSRTFLMRMRSLSIAPTVRGLFLLGRYRTTAPDVRCNQTVLHESGYVVGCGPDEGLCALDPGRSQRSNQVLPHREHPLEQRAATTTLSSAFRRRGNEKQLTRESMHTQTSGDSH